MSSLKIYLAWRGCYSDASVIGAFTDEANADALAKAVDPSDGRVQEIEVDNPKLLDVARDLASWCWQSQPMRLFDVTSLSRSIEVAYVCDVRGDDWNVGSVQDEGGALRMICVARDEAHATKIAADKFREFAALHNWPPKALHNWPPKALHNWPPKRGGK